MSEVVKAFGKEIEIEVCHTCQGTGNASVWNRTTRQIEQDSRYYCDTCKGAKYIVVSHWKPNEN